MLYLNKQKFTKKIHFLLKVFVLYKFFYLNLSLIRKLDKEDQHHEVELVNYNVDNCCRKFN